MPRGLILSLLSASDQNSATCRMHGSFKPLSHPLFSSTALSRVKNGFITSQLLFHTVQRVEFQSASLLMPPTKPYLTLPAACNFLLMVTSCAQVLGSSLSLSRSVR